MTHALTIAGSDPTGGAGLQADLQVFHALGVHGTGVITALTVQDSQKVHSVLPVFPNVILEQLRVLLSDLPPAAVKIGMLGTDDSARNVLLALGSLDPLPPIVVDPVLRASDGTSLLERRAFGALRALFSLAKLVTPNLDEAQELSGEDPRTRKGAENAARKLLESGAEAILIKGGHRDGAPSDLLAMRERDGERFEWLEGKRIEVGRVHGTGCALSAAIAAYLARGETTADAVTLSREFIQRAIEHSLERGAGARFLVFP